MERSLWPVVCRVRIRYRDAEECQTRRRTAEEAEDVVGDLAALSEIASGTWVGCGLHRVAPMSVPLVEIIEIVAQLDDRRTDRAGHLQFQPPSM
jgi:hypothetical protein